LAGSTDQNAAWWLRWEPHLGAKILIRGVAAFLDISGEPR